MKQLCNSCPRKCNAVRTDYENIGGYCAAPLLPKIARADLHFGEEPCISGTGGSGTIFFSGCNMRCVYCQNYEISHLNKGKIISVEELAEIFRELEKKGAHNINFVNPTHYIETIKAALKIYTPKIPLVCNTSGYELRDSIKQNIFDIYLFDLKYFSVEKALKYSAASDYFEKASEALKAAYELIPECVLDENGIMQSGIIVRHLLLPSATKEAISIIDWFFENTPNAYFSLMAQYVPCGKAELYKEINRRVTEREYNKVLNHLLNKGEENIFIQDIISADKKYIPDFNLF